MHLNLNLFLSFLLYQVCVPLYLCFSAHLITTAAAGIVLDLLISLHSHSLHVSRPILPWSFNKINPQSGHQSLPNHGPCSHIRNRTLCITISVESPCSKSTSYCYSRNRNTIFVTVRRSLSGDDSALGLLTDEIEHGMERRRRKRKEQLMRIRL